MSPETVATVAEQGREAAEAAASHGHPEIPNLITLLNSIAGENPLVHFLHSWENQFFMVLIICFLTWIVRRAYRERSIVPTPLQNVIEMFIEAFEGLVVGMMGEKEGRRYLPFVGTLFIYILFMNLWGLIPFMKSPTSAIQTTAALAICVFLYVQYSAITRLGFIGFLDHLMGSPRDVIGWCLVPLFLPLHIVEELVKPVSLSCRLFGNILGEDILLGVALMLGIGMLSIMHVGVPLHFPFVFLAMLTSTIQALVFSLLATVYISMFLPHEEGHH
ncbi:MAG TPA: F0F1 ATP synthase subunit A [bacterium]|nr:F0F1 ATP synthase subunit A [bacterium]HQL63208.1 F0F1 ATP synthase subunit A [bacterium]